MKIKQVCNLTHLTPRAVRFYCDRGLIAPETYYVNERNYYEFSEEDVRMLRRVCALRQARFSLEQITRMLRAPEEIAQIVRLHRRELAEQAQRERGIIACLRRLAEEDMSAFDAFADALLEEENRIALMKESME